MSLILPKQNDFENAPSGSYPAICYRVIDLGTQFSDFYQKSSHKILISWEIDEKMKDGRRFSTHKRYTLSSSKNAVLRKDLESWRGQAFTDDEFGTFDIGVLIGKGCMVGVTTSAEADKTFSNVTSIMKLPKGLPPMTLENESLYFSLNSFKQDVYDKLAEGLKAIIAKSPEYQELKDGHVTEANLRETHDHVPTFEGEEVPF